MMSSVELFRSCYYSSRLISGADVHRRCEEENGSNEEEKVYVHPLVKKSSTKLSKKSLEMCTESLGSESGSDMGENDMYSNILTLLEAGDENVVRCSSTWMPKKANRRDTSSSTTTYPPPLTSISGSTGVRVESYREDGRLVLRAVATTSASRTSYFHAQRSLGRLKLQLVKHTDGQVIVEEEGDEEVLEENDEEEEEIGMENHFNGRPLMTCTSTSSSCKQGRRQTKDLLNWEPLWVST